MKTTNFKDGKQGDELKKILETIKPAKTSASSIFCQQSSIVDRVQKTLFESPKGIKVRGFMSENNAIKHLLKIFEAQQNLNDNEFLSTRMGRDGVEKWVAVDKAGKFLRIL